MKLILEAMARDDLREIDQQGQRLFGPRQTARYGLELRQAMELLVRAPFAWRERVEFDPPLRVYRHKAHVILYRIEGDAVVILRVRHGREDWAPE